MHYIIFDEVRVTILLILKLTKYICKIHFTVNNILFDTGVKRGTIQGACNKVLRI